MTSNVIANEYRGICMSNLKRALKDRGISQMWLVEHTGMTQAWMNRIVNDKSIPNVYDAQKIARLLGVLVEELWPLEEVLGEDEQ